MEERKNKGAFMVGIDRMTVEDGIPMPEMSEDDVLIRIEYVGVCGSDVHYFHDGRCGSFVIEEERDIPFMLGHECAGTIVDMGKNVTELKIGDRVCVEPGKTCGKCEFCKSGHYNLCKDVRFLATPPVQGCYMRYLAFPAELCFKLPDHVSTKAGALIEPLATGMYAAKLGEITTGDTVVILGTGCIGLMTLLACRARGASKIIACDLEDIRLEKAKELGADYTVNSRNRDMAEEIMGLTDGRGADVVFETAGSPATIAFTPEAARRGGMVILVGMAAQPEILFNFGTVMEKKLRIKALFRYVNMFPMTIAAVESGLIPVEKVATHEYKLDEIQQAFEDYVTLKNEIVKAVIRID